MIRFDYINKNKYLIAICLIIISFLVFQYFNSNNKNPTNTIVPVAKVIVSGKQIDVAVARTAQEKANGLSGKTYLAEDEGIIFVFPQKTYPSFWMVDMNFALDIIWISDNTIIHIDENVPPPKNGQKNQDLPLYKPPKAINYVLEVNAGFANENHIKVGDKVELSNLE